MRDKLQVQTSINYDLAESYGNFKIGNDEKIMPYITSTNVSCGLHAGDPLTIVKILRLAKKHNVEVEAHPNCPDHFSRPFFAWTSKTGRHYYKNNTARSARKNKRIL